MLTAIWHDPQLPSGTCPVSRSHTIGKHWNLNTFFLCGSGEINRGMLASHRPSILSTSTRNMPTNEISNQSNRLSKVSALFSAATIILALIQSRPFHQHHAFLQNIERLRNTRDLYAGISDRPQCHHELTLERRRGGRKCSPNGKAVSRG